jgi:hypothetical protein
MDAIGITKIFEDVIKDYETSESHCILFYSTDKDRDYKILYAKVKEHREKFGKWLAGKNGEEYVISEDRVESGA